MPAKPLKVVMIRRGNSNISDVPADNLITFIRKNILLGTDELSGDGKSWVRVDQHYQLRKYFSSNEKEEALVVAQNKSSSDDPVPFKPPSSFKNELEEMASLLKDING
tara:strand:+ start:3832 stop:4155 length:324 start_codon:yes stop_codon:yes gene_type:complete